MFVQTLLLGAVWAKVAYSSPIPQDNAAAAPTATTALKGYPAVVHQNGYTSATFHGSYTGTPTTTGAVNGPATLAASIPALPPNPTATYYNADGVPKDPFPAPYTPAGGLGTNGTLPRYMVESDFDFESISLGLYQEWIELVSFPHLHSRINSLTNTGSVPRWSRSLHRC
jgi:hypothetical protein